jgi:hypothetical protein
MKVEGTLNDEALMMRYLNGELTEQERHAFEASQMDDPFASDAIEGLKSISPQNAEKIHGELKASLASQIGKKRKKRRIPFIQSQLIFYVTLAIILIILIVVSFMIIKLKN